MSAQRFMEKDREEGLKQGVKKGIRQGEALVLLRQLALRFMSLPDSIEVRVESANADLC